MTALVSMFNFLLVYLRYFTTIIFGGRFYAGDFSNVEQETLAKQIIFQLSDGAYDYLIYLPGEPFLLICISVFVFGACISLARRLIRG